MTEEQPKEVPQEAQTPAQDAQPTDKKERGRGNKRGFGRGQNEVQEDKKKRNGSHALTLED